MKPSPLLLATLLCTVTALPASAQSAARTPTEQHNLGVVLDYWEHTIRPLNAARLKDFVPANFIEHEPTSQNTLDSLVKYIRQLHQQYPNGLPGSRVLMSSVDGDLVTLICERGKVDDSKDPAYGSIRLGIEVFRVKNGKQAEHWGDLMRASDATQDTIKP